MEVSGKGFMEGNKLKEVGGLKKREKNQNFYNLG